MWIYVEHPCKRRYPQVKRYATVLKSYALLKFYDVQHVIVYVKTWTWSTWRNIQSFLEAALWEVHLYSTTLWSCSFFLVMDLKGFTLPPILTELACILVSLSYLFIIFCIYVPRDPHSIQTHLCSASCHVRKPHQIWTQKCELMMSVLDKSSQLEAAIQ